MCRLAMSRRGYPGSVAADRIANNKEQPLVAHGAGPPPTACPTDPIPCNRRRHCLQLRWLIAGVLFGLLFPLVGWTIAITKAGIDGFSAAHVDQPVLYIVDLAPFVLGLTGFAIGHFHARLVRIRQSVEQEVDDRTAELRQAMAELERTQEEKDRFVAGVSHELRTPLTSVIGLARALEESSEPFNDEERSELLHLIVRESEEVAAIVEDLLVAARIDRDELSIAHEWLRLDEELCQIAKVCEVEIQPARIEPVAVLGDPVRIHQIIRNLITNADRYGGDVVTVDVYNTESTAVLAVCDNGPGVPPDKIDLIFTAFGKAHSDPTRTESVGLGLTVSRNLARLMGGDVTYERCNEWTCFQLHLPVAPDQPPQDSMTAHQAAQGKDRASYATAI